MITIFIQLIDQLSKQTSYEDHVTESIFFGFQYIYSNITISFSSQLKYNLENSSKAEYNSRSRSTRSSEERVKRKEEKVHDNWHETLTL